MPLCPKCGSQVAEGVKFCPSCGASIAPAATVPPSQPSSQPPISTGSQGGLAPNVAAMLTYTPLCAIGLVCTILFGFILEPFKKDRFVRFHAWQSLALHGIFIAFWVGWTIFSMVLTAIAHFFAVLTVPVSILVAVGFLVLMVILMVKAYGNEIYKLPFVGDWAEKQAGALPPIV